MIEQVLQTALREALASLAPRAHGLRSHALPTETHLDACLVAIQRALNAEQLAASRVVVGSSGPRSTRLPPNIVVLPSDAAAAEATRLRNEPKALAEGGLLLYFNTDSTPGEAGLDGLTELTSPEIVHAFARHAALPLLQALASSRSRRVLTRLEDASVSLLGEYAKLAEQHSEAYALPLLGFLPRSKGALESVGSIGADEFDGLHGIKAAGRLREAHSALLAVSEEDRARLGAALAQRLPADVLRDGADAVEQATRLCAAAARFSSGEDDEPRKLHGLTIDLVRLLKRGAEGIRALSEQEVDDGGTRDPDDSDPGESELSLAEEEFLQAEGAPAFLRPLEVEPGWQLTLRHPTEGSSVRLRTRASLGLLRRVQHHNKGVEEFWIHGGALLVGDVDALVAKSVSPAVKADAIFDDVQTAVEPCSSELREAVDVFLQARTKLLQAAGAVATTASGYSPDATEEEQQAEGGDEQVPSSSTLAGVTLLELFPLTAAARCAEASRSYVAAYEAMLEAAFSSAASVRQSLSEWLTNLDLAFVVEGKNVKAARLLPTHPLRIAHSLLWLQSINRPPALPPTLAVHYKQTELLLPQGREHLFGASEGISPNETGLALAGSEGLIAAWSLLRPHGLATALEIELVDVAHPSPVVDALCRVATEFFNNDAEAGRGLHLEVRCAYSSPLYKDDVRVPASEGLATLTHECLSTPRGSGVSLSLTRTPLAANARPCHLAIQVVETPFISFKDEGNAAELEGTELVYTPGPGGNISLVEVRGNTTLDRYQGFLKGLYVQSPRLGLNPSNQSPEVGDALVKALVAGGGWPIPPRSETSLASLLSYNEGHDHIVAVLADKEVLSRALTRGLLNVSRAIEGADLSLEHLRQGILAMYSCRGFLQGLIAESSPSHLLGMLGLLRAFDAAREESRQAPTLVLSLDSPEGRRWVQALMRHDRGTATRADLLFIEADAEFKSVTRLRVAELKARATTAELSSERALAKLAAQAQTAAGRLRACFVTGSAQSREQVEALRRFLWLGAGHQQKALDWTHVLASLDSALHSGSAPEVVAECWIVPEQPWHGESRFERVLPPLGGTAYKAAEERVQFRVLEHQNLRTTQPEAPRRPAPSSAGGDRVLGGSAPLQASPPPSPPPAATVEPIRPPAPPAPSETSHAAPSVPTAPPSPAASPMPPQLSRSPESARPLPAVASTDGICVTMGKTLTGEPALWLPNRTDLVPHFNVGITGTMGTGKTQLTKSLLAQLIWQGDANPKGRSPGLLIFDYKGDYIDTPREAFATAIGATVHPPEELPLNPLRPSTPRTRQEFTLMTRLFVDTLMAIAPNMGINQRNEVIRGLRECYAAAGIDEKDPKTWDRPFPTLTDLLEVLQTNELGEGLPQSVIQDLVELNVFAAKDPQVDMDAFFDGINVIDLKPLGGTPTSIRAILSFFMNTFYDRMLHAGEAPLEARGEGESRYHLRQLRRFVLVDEADDFIGLNLNSLKNVMQQGRSFGCGVILSTQFLHHFNKSETPLRPLIATWVLHQMTDVNPTDLKALFALSSRDEVSELAAQLSTLPKHTSLCSGLSRPVSRARLLKIRDMPFMDLTPPKVAR